MNGGRFDFDDGGTFCGGWEEGKAHGHGVCTGPSAQGEYAGAWHYGFEVSGVYTWPSGSYYMGQWQNGKRHGLGVEQRGRWLYKGEWSQGFKGRYGRREALNSGAHYLGTWSSGLHDGYGAEIYTDGGSYKGQWLRGMRHGYGIRVSAPFSDASKYRSRSSNTHASLTSLRSNYGEEEEDELADAMPSARTLDGRGKLDREETRSGFVLKARSTAPAKRRRSLSERSLAVKRTILSGLRIKKQHSTGDIRQRPGSIAGSIRSSGSTLSFASNEYSHHHHHNHHHAFRTIAEEKIEPTAVEVYKGEWKNDVRSGYGVCERSDGLRYAGEWQDNKKHGYGITYYKDGSREEGRYKRNVLISSTKRRAFLFTRSSKLRERIELHVENARRAAEIAIERVDIASSRTATAQERADAAVESADRARDDADTARIYAAQFDPTFHQPGLELMRQNRHHVQSPYPQMMPSNHVPPPISANHVSFETATLMGPAIMQPSTSSSISPPSQPIPYDTRQEGLRLATQPNISTNHHHLHTQLKEPSEFTSVQQQHSPLQANTMPTAGQQPGSGGGGFTLLETSNTEPSLANKEEWLKQRQHGYSEETPTQADTQQMRPESSGLPAQLHVQTAHQHSGYDSSRHLNSKLVGNSLPIAGGNSPSTTAQLRPTRGRGEGGASVTVSLSDDHFDQYTMRRVLAANNPQAMSPIPSSTFSPTASSILQEIGSSVETGGLDETPTPSEEQPRLRRNRPSLIRQFEVNDIAMLNRRSTLATSRGAKNNFQAHPATQRAQLPPLVYGVKSDGEKGSLPNLDELGAQEIQLRREEAAILASHQRLENQRMLEEEQKLRSNPLRYIFHPSLRNWVVRWKFPLLLLLGNILLLYYLVHLLTTTQTNLNEGDNVHSGQ